MVIVKPVRRVSSEGQSGIQASRGPVDAMAMPLTTQGASKKPAKISAKLNPAKTSNPFSSERARFRTPFAHEHARGGVPVHIQHSGNTMSLAWDCKPEAVDEGRLVVLSSAGLLEKAHPCAFLAPALLENLLQREGVGERAVVPVLDKVVPNLRAALGDPESYTRAVHACDLVSTACGAALNKHLASLLVPISKHLHIPAHRSVSEEVLFTFEQNGGPEASKVIKAKIPTFAPTFRLNAAKPAPKRAAFT